MENETTERSTRDKALRLSATALAAGVSALWSNGAHAIVVAQDLVTQVFNLSAGSSSNGVSVQIGTGAPYGQAQFIFYGGQGITPEGTAGIVGTNDDPSCTLDCNGKITLLSPGTVIGPSSSFVTGSLVAPNGIMDFPIGTTKTTPTYIGLEFDIDGQDPYGYGTLDSSGDLISITYDANGGPVTIPTATATPEPATLSLLALGAAGVGALRRRRRPGAASH